MAPKPKRPDFLTDEAVQNLKLAPGALYADPWHPNLFVRGGKHSKTYYAVARQLGGKQVWTKIGRTNLVSIKAAQDETLRIVEKIRAGETTKEVTPAAVTLADVVAAYKKKTGQHQRRWRDKDRRLKRWLLPAFGRRPFLDIKRGEVNALLDKIEATSARGATQVLVDLQALEKHFLSMSGVPEGYAMRFRGGLVPTRSKPNPRKRTLKLEELRAVWTAAGDAGRFGVIVKLCLLSAQRITKILSMKWDDVDLGSGDWTIPRLPGEKGAPEVLPLPPVAIELIETQPKLDNDYVFASVRGNGHIISLNLYKRDLDARLPKMPRWVIHDLRRSAKTYMAELDVPPYVSEKILGHELGGVEGIYDQSKLKLPMKSALATLAGFIETTVAVVPIERAA
jgi:integrase